MHLTCAEVCVTEQWNWERPGAEHVIIEKGARYG